MAGISKERLAMRQIQGLATVLSCLPPGGKCREFFTLALDSPEGPWLDKISRPDDPDSDEGMKSWLEGLWGAEDLSADARKIPEWQANSDNMGAAIAELQALTDKLGAS